MTKEHLIIDPEKINDPKYWESILAKEGMPEELPTPGESSPCNDSEELSKMEEIEEYSFPDIENDEIIDTQGCKNCNPKKMHQKGCCSGAVARSIGKETRFIKDTNTGIMYEICDSLRVNLDGEWGCEDYSNRDIVCRAFDCADSIAAHLNED